MKLREYNSMSHNSDSNEIVHDRMRSLQQENEQLSRQLEEMQRTLNMIITLIIEKSADGQLPPDLAHLLNELTRNEYN